MSNKITHAGGDQAPPRRSNVLARLATSNVPYIVLYVFAVALIALTDRHPAAAQAAWYFFIPLIGLVSAASGWRTFAGDTTPQRIAYVARQLLHWGALILVIHLLFSEDVQAFLDAEADGFVIIYLVGLTSLLGGIYLDWKMALFGIFLIYSGVLIAFLDDNALLMVLSLTALMVVTVTAFVWVSHNKKVMASRKTGAALKAH